MPGVSGSIRFKRIIDAVADDPARDWNATTRDETFPADANAILEALIAEHGVEATLEALVNQGFSGDYRYAAKPIFDEANRRRTQRQERRSTEGSREFAGCHPHLPRHVVVHREDAEMKVTPVR